MASESAVCINIGRKHRQQRLIVGLLNALLTVGVAIFLVVNEGPALAYVLVFGFAFGAAVGVLQYTTSTCVAFAFQGRTGLHENDFDTDALTDKTMLRALRIRSLGIVARALGLALAMTIALYGLGNL